MPYYYTSYGIRKSLLQGSHDWRIPYKLHAVHLCIEHTQRFELKQLFILAQTSFERLSVDLSYRDSDNFRHLTHTAVTNSTRHTQQNRFLSDHYVLAHRFLFLPTSLQRIYKMPPVSQIVIISLVICLANVKHLHITAE